MAHRILMQRLSVLRPIACNSVHSLSKTTSQNIVKQRSLHPALLQTSQGMPTCSFHASATHFNEHIINIQDEDHFEEHVKKNSVPVIVDFHAHWCGPCKLLGPRLESLVAEQKGKTILAKVDIDDLGELAIDHGVEAVPTVIAVKNGKVVDKFVGLKDETEIQSFIDKLVVGSEGVGKHQLAKALVDIKTTFSLQVRTATKLPLPPKNADNRPTIDFIVFMIDLTNRHSMAVTEAAVSLVDVTYFLGRSCFVVVEANNITDRSVDIEGATQLADAHDTPLLCGNLRTAEERSVLAKKILTMVEIAAGFVHNVTPLLVGSTHHPYQTVQTL